MGTMMMKMSITEAVCQLAIIRTCDTWFRPYLCSIRLLSSVVVDECFISKKKKDDECDHEAGQVVFFAHAFCSSRVDLTDVSVWYVHFFS